MEVSSKKTKLVLLGGFLGSGELNFVVISAASGKTTLLVRLGKRLVQQGLTIGILTNDQGEYLVDTKYAKSEGFVASEVMNGCFCCRFEDFINNVEGMMKDTKLDIILAEPVGSCTDLLATVVAPLNAYHSSLVTIAPLFVVVDGLRICKEYKEGMNLSSPVQPKEVLVSHQIREAEVILVSKVDVMNEEMKKTAKEYLNQLNSASDKDMIFYSSKSGEGLEKIAAVLLSEESNLKSPIPLDYTTYAEAEAEYGWNNGTFKLTLLDSKETKSEEHFNAATFCDFFLLHFSSSSFGHEVAHAKVFVATPKGSLKRSVVGDQMDIEEDCSDMLVNSAVITLNIRARSSPQVISAFVDKITTKTCKEYGVSSTDYHYSAIVPSPPKPTHRFPL